MKGNESVMMEMAFKDIATKHHKNHQMWHYENHTGK